MAEFDHDDKLARLTINPLAGLSFEESLLPAKLVDAIERNIQQGLLEAARLTRGDTFALGIGSVSLTRESYIVVFQGTSREFVRTAEGLKAVTRDSSGHFVEIAKIDEFATWLNRLSKVSSLIVTVAHIISGADLSRRLGRVESKIDGIVDRIEGAHRAELQVAYERLRSALDQQHPDQSALTQCIESFKKLRSLRSDLVRKRLRTMRGLNSASVQSEMAPSRLWTVGQKLGDVATDLTPPVVTKATKKAYQLGSAACTATGKRLHEWRTKEGSKAWLRQKDEVESICAALAEIIYCLQLECIASSALNEDHHYRDYTLPLQEAAECLIEQATRLGPLEEEVSPGTPFSNFLASTAKAIVPSKQSERQISEKTSENP